MMTYMETATMFGKFSGTATNVRLWLETLSDRNDVPEDVKIEAKEFMKLITFYENLVKVMDLPDGAYGYCAGCGHAMVRIEDRHALEANEINIACSIGATSECENGTVQVSRFL
jgi:hypothetical protein